MSYNKHRKRVLYQQLIMCQGILSLLCPCPFVIFGKRYLSIFLLVLTKNLKKKFQTYWLRNNYYEYNE